MEFQLLRYGLNRSQDLEYERCVAKLGNLNIPYIQETWSTANTSSYKYI